MALITSIPAGWDATSSIYWETQRGLDPWSVPFLPQGFFHVPVPPGSCPSGPLSVTPSPPSFPNLPPPLTSTSRPPPYPGLSLTLKTAPKKRGPGRGVPCWVFPKNVIPSTPRRQRVSSESPVSDGRAAPGGGTGTGLRGRAAGMSREGSRRLSQRGPIHVRSSWAPWGNTKFQKARLSNFGLHKIFQT